MPKSKQIGTLNLSISALSKAYATGDLTPKDVIKNIAQNNLIYSGKNIWIYQLNQNELSPYLDALVDKKPEDYPLWGIPFAIKDNIDLEGIPTTAACPEFSYTPDKSATVVQQLIDAGAIPIGKTNLDQFATGLNGTRSPYGACQNSFNSKYISGGSSAGSSVSVALGLASFSLGTDTAGSGRVPACFNNLVGMKPSRGLLSNTGVVRACRSLDCISIFSLNTDDANTVLAVAEGYDESDEYSRKNPYKNVERHYRSMDMTKTALHNASEKSHTKALTIGVLAKDQLEFFGDDAYAEAYDESIKKLSGLNIEFVEIDSSPFLAAAKLLYEGPWVSERYIGTSPLVKENPDAMLDVIQVIIEPAGQLLATDAFASQYKLLDLKNQCLKQMETIDCLLTPTTSKHFTIDEMFKDPIIANNQLGQYTNFVNLLDFSAIAIPTCFTNKKLPFGVTLIADHFEDRKLLSIANSIQQYLKLPLGATEFELAESELASKSNQSNGVEDNVQVAVCGAHLEGQPLNWQLTERGGSLIEKTTTADGYRLYALAGGPPFRPALVYDEASKRGSNIEIEIWSLPITEFGSFVAAIPAPLGIGKVILKDGSSVPSFICESHGVIDATEITQFGGWREYLKSLV